MAAAMSKKPKPTPADPKNTLQVAGLNADPDKVTAQITLRPSVQGAITIKQWTKPLGDSDLTHLVDELRALSDAAIDGNLKRGEAMLMVQAQTLDALFNELARRAGNNLGHYPETVDRYMRLALKAQSQCRTTIETLAEIKNPRPVAFVRQQNIANNQQVNNGAQPAGELIDQYAQAHAGARETNSQPNELLEAQHGERLDTGATATAGRVDSQLEAVGAINGTEDVKR